MDVRMEQLVNNDNEHVAPLSHLCPPLIRDSEYSHDGRARVRISRATLKLYNEDKACETIIALS